MSKIEKECQHCGKTFLADTRELNRGNAKYCSLLCSSKAPKRLQYNQVCKHCGKEFLSASKNAKYCSSSCKQKHYRFLQKTEKIDDHSIKYFYKTFKDIPCEICGWDKTGRDLHHILEVSNGGTNEIDNLISVCPNCHRSIHTNVITKEEIDKIIKNRSYIVQL